MNTINSSKSPLVSIITVNYNHSEDTIELLDSIKKITYPNIECIVLDNGSEIDNPDIIKRKYPEINFIKNKKNIGFAAANNIGIMHANGEYILLINNDMVVSDDFLSPLLKTLQKNPEIGVVCPKIYFYDEPRNIQYAGYTEINPFTIRNIAIGYNEPDKGQYDKDSITAFAHGGAIMFPTKLLNNVGKMSEYFFLYYEDIDWCKRVRYAGYKICYVHNSVVYHKDGATTGSNSPLKTYYINRGRLIYMRRHIRFPLIIVSMLYIFLFAFPKNILVFIIKKEFLQCKAYLSAFGWFIRHIFDKDMTLDHIHF